MDYILRRDKGLERYFYREGQGILLASETDMYFPEAVCKEATGPFCVYEKNEAVHIISVGAGNELLYITGSGREMKMYLLCGLAAGLEVIEMKTASVGGRTDLLYSAKYKDETLLIHCVLGNHAKPSVIDKISGGYFYPYKGKVYYTNAAQVMGYQDLSDGKPEHFRPVSEGARDVYIRSFGGDECMVYTKDETVFIDHIPKFKIKDVQNPILCRRGSSIILILKSGRTLKYIDIKSNDKEPFKNILSSSEMTLCAVSENGETYYEYAAKGTGQPYFFETVPAKTKKSDNISGRNDINNDLLRLKEEIEKLEEKIRKLQ